jgi:hypothetical protein
LQRRAGKIGAVRMIHIAAEEENIGAAAGV